MMIQIRKGVFETNSSSTHSLCISRAKINETNLPSTVYFGLDHYGWEHDCVDDTKSYLYTAIMDIYNKELGTKCLQRLKDILEKHNIAATFQAPTEYPYWGIDHVDELEDFIDRITQDEDMLLRFLFHPASCVYTGNDNSHDDDDICRCAEPRILDTTTWKMIDNPLHDSEHFEYEYKSN